MPPIDLLRHMAMYLPRRLWLSRVAKESAKLRPENQKLIIIFSSDTEFDPPLRNGTWKQRSTKGLLDGMPRLLELCDRYNASATLFCEGRLVEELPDLFREYGRNHEVGCHSYNHEWMGTKQPPRWIPHRQELQVLPVAAKLAMLRRAVTSIERVLGGKPKSFKAPFNSVDHASTLALLEQVGFDSDSSLPCYNTESLGHPLRPAPCHHASAKGLWSDGGNDLVEVPFMIRPMPLFLHPYDVREEVIDTARRGMKLALESVEFQCRIDLLSGRNYSLVHVTSHPWEFSEMKQFGGHGKENAKRLQMYFEEVLSKYDATFLTVAEFTARWEKEWCRLHSLTASSSD